MISHATGSAYDYMGLFRKGNGLGYHVKATYQNGRPQPYERSNRLELFSDLHTKFSCRRHHDRKKRLWLFQQFLDYWDGEGGSLS